MAAVGGVVAGGGVGGAEASSCGSASTPANDTWPPRAEHQEGDRAVHFPSGGPSAPGRRWSLRPLGRGGHCRRERDVGPRDRLSYLASRSTPHISRFVATQSKRSAAYPTAGRVVGRRRASGQVAHMDLASTAGSMMIGGGVPVSLAGPQGEPPHGMADVHGDIAGLSWLATRLAVSRLLREE